MLLKKRKKENASKDEEMQEESEKENKTDDESSSSSSEEAEEPKTSKAKEPKEAGKPNKQGEDDGRYVIPSEEGPWATIVTSIKLDEKGAKLLEETGIDGDALNV